MSSSTSYRRQGAGSTAALAGILTAGALLLVVPFFTAAAAARAGLALVFLFLCFLSFSLARRLSKARDENNILEKKIGEKEADLSAMKAEQRNLVNTEKIDALGRFSSIVAHELKNPLASLKNISYFLTKTSKAEDERSKRMLDMLSSEIDRTNNMVTDLSDMSKVKRINKSLVRVLELADKILADLKLGETVKVVRDVTDIEANLDPDRFRQILGNLMTNARDAMPDGGQIDLTVKKDGEMLELTVKDTGTGMDREVLDHIFEPMFTTKTKVLGLGLTVVKEVVDAHGGRIDVQSEKGKGSAFKVSLPA